MTAREIRINIGDVSVWHRGPAGRYRVPEQARLSCAEAARRRRAGVALWLDRDCTVPWEPATVTVDPGTPGASAVRYPNGRVQQHGHRDSRTTQVLAWVVQHGPLPNRRRPVFRALGMTSPQCACAVASLRQAGMLDGNEITELGRRTLAERMEER